MWVAGLPVPQNPFGFIFGAAILVEGSDLAVLTGSGWGKAINGYGAGEHDPFDPVLFRHRAKISGRFDIHLFIER